MAYDKRKMQDIAKSEKNLWTQYKTLWTNGDFNNLNTFLNDNPNLKYKLFDAFNWNRLINLVNDQTTADLWDNTKTYKIYDMVSYDNYIWVSKQDDNQNHIPQYGSFWQQIDSITNTQTATYDSLVGKWQKDYGDLKNIVDNFEYIGVWETGQEYKLGNLVNTDSYHSYFCLQNHTSSADNQPSNTTYWVEAEAMLDPVGIQVSEIVPTNLTVGDIYFQIIT